MESTIRVANGIQLGVVDEGEGDPVVFIHGFPELAYSWRHQIPALVDSGFRAIAYDQRGYGSSAKPESVDAYNLNHLVADAMVYSTHSTLIVPHSSATTGAASWCGPRP